MAILRRTSPEESSAAEPSAKSPQTILPPVAAAPVTAAPMTPAPVTVPPVAAAPTPTPVPITSSAPVTPRAQVGGVALFGDLGFGRLALRSGRSRSLGRFVERFSLCRAGRDKLRRCDEQRAETETGQG